MEEVLVQHVPMYCTILIKPRTSQYLHHYIKATGCLKTTLTWCLGCNQIRQILAAAQFVRRHNGENVSCIDLQPRNDKLSDVRWLHVLVLVPIPVDLPEPYPIIRLHAAIEPGYPTQRHRIMGRVHDRQKIGWVRSRSDLQTNGARGESKLVLGNAVVVAIVGGSYVRDDESGLWSQWINLREHQSLR